MIDNLNAITFGRYGMVIHEGFLHACKSIGVHDLDISEQNINSKMIKRLVCHNDSPAVIDITDGIALLCVLEDVSHNDYHVFLLDKAIVINPGVCYGVYALYSNCNIKIAKKKNALQSGILLTNTLTAQGLYPKIDINKVHTLFYQEKERGFIFKGERHGFWELTYVDKGIMDTVIDGIGFRVNQGEAIFYAKQQHHIQWSPPNESICFVTITFDMEIQDNSYLRNRKIVVDSEMKNLIEKIIVEKEHNSFYMDDLIICYLKEFVIKLIRNEKLETIIHKQETHIKDKIENSIVEKSIEFICKNISKKLSVADVAGSVPISQSYLSILFKRHMDMTLVNYINSYRLEKSKDLIRSSQHNFTQIADILGYASVHYFSNQFKAKYGVSPTEYSKAIRG